MDVGWITAYGYNIFFVWLSEMTDKPTDIARLRGLHEGMTPNKNVNVVCPNSDCKGVGEYRVWAQGKYRTGYMKCPDCKGTGEVWEGHDHPALNRKWKSKRREYEMAVIYANPALLDELEGLRKFALDYCEARIKYHEEGNADFFFWMLKPHHDFLSKLKHNLTEGERGE